MAFLVSSATAFLVFLSLLFLVGGLVLVGGGIYALVTFGKANDLVTVNLPIGMIVIGATVALVSFLVCLAARKGNRKFLFCTWAVVILVLFVQAGVAIAIFIERNNIDGQLTDSWDSSSSETQASIERSFGCCGWTSSNNTDVQQCGTSKPNPPSCRSKLDNLFQNNLFAIAVAACALLGVEVFALLVICCLTRALKQQHDKEKYEAI